MVRREAGKVTAHLLFNTVRRDRRERTYVLSEEGFSRLASATGSHLEEMSRGMSGLTSLQCVKCQSIFSQELAQSRRKKSLEVCCINCGSNMVIEVETERDEGDEIAVGIPVCEALDLESILPQTTTRLHSDSIPEKTYLPLDPDTPTHRRPSQQGKCMSIQVRGV